MECGPRRMIQVGICYPMLYESLMVYMLCLTDMVSQRGPSIISNHTPHPHMLSNLSRFSGPRSGNLRPLLLLGGGVVQWWWCRCGYDIPLLQESWRIRDSYLTGRNGIACPFHGHRPCITLPHKVRGGPWLDIQTEMIAHHVWCITVQTKAIWYAVNQNTLQLSPQ